MTDTAIFLAEGFEEIEGLMVVDLLRRVGIKVDMVSISDSLTVTGSHKIAVTADKLLKDIDFNRFLDKETDQENSKTVSLQDLQVENLILKRDGKQLATELT